MNIGNEDDCFEIQGADQLYFIDNKTSISQLETYFACPYQYFINYGLRLKENKNAQLSSLDIGSIVHKIVEIFVENITHFNALESKTFDEEVEELVKKIYKEFHVNENKNKALLLFLLDELKRLCRYILSEQESSSFKASENEFVFEKENAIRIKLDSGNEICIAGKIDRIDKFKNYIRIIDYKTGDISSDLKSVYYGKKIQLISYLMAVRSIDGAKVAGVFYFPIHSDYVKNGDKNTNIYKMQGFLLDNIDVVKYMDSSLSFEKPESLFVPLKIKNGKENLETGVLEISHGLSKNYLTDEEFEKVSDYSMKLCKQAIEEIQSGYIEPAPYSETGDEKTSACKWCEFAGFCGKEKSRFAEGRICNAKIDIGEFDL